MFKYELQLMLVLTHRYLCQYKNTTFDNILLIYIIIVHQVSHFEGGSFFWQPPEHVRSPHIIDVNYFYCINTYIRDKFGGYIQTLNIAIYFVILITIFTSRNINELQSAYTIVWEFAHFNSSGDFKKICNIFYKSKI